MTADLQIPAETLTDEERAKYADSGYEAAAPLTVGQSWADKNSILAYPIRIMANSSRAVDGKAPDGSPAIVLTLDNADFADQLATHPNPRVQLEPPHTLLTVGGTFRETYRIWVPRGALVFSGPTWCVLTQEQGPPYKGSPPYSLATRDGKTWGLTNDGTPEPPLKPWASDFALPIPTGRWVDWTWVAKYATKGHLAVHCDGKRVFEAPFATIDATNSSGLSFNALDVYAKRGSFSKLGPIYFQRHTITRIA